MKRRIIAVTLTVVLVIGGAIAGIGFLIYSETSKRYNIQRVIFEMADKEGDDYGPGSYVYPTDSIFDPQAEHFDLVNFRVSVQRDYYYFDLTFPRATNPWGAAEGFSHQICQIYIANGSDHGKIETFKEGAKVVFTHEWPWTSMIKVVSFGKTAVYSATDHSDSEGRLKGVTAKLEPDGKTIRVSVPRQYIDGEPANWAYYVLIGSQDGSGPDNYRPVLKEQSGWNFSGGSGTRFHPNVLDVLAPDDGPYSQEAMLSSYDVEKGRLAELYPVGPGVVEMSYWARFLDYMEQVFGKYDIDL